ncbi:hypothetical protein [Paenibacillus graminis]|uniref:hypothetical protein n=1 Tax=Paenibacillus graminis TaxID=189425 RepID=UPI0012DE4139|nr:hypothetical protein [Paenibacillus graminis]
MNTFKSLHSDAFKWQASKSRRTPCEFSKVVLQHGVNAVSPIRTKSAASQEWRA